MRDSGVSGFSQRAARWVGGAALLSLVAAFWLLLRPGERAAVDSVDADGYSRSAIGHLGFVRLLRELGEPVLQLRHDRPLESCGLLVLAEPRLSGPDDERFDLAASWAEQAPLTLLALQKRTGTRDPALPHWNDDVGLVDLDEAVRPLAALAAERSWGAPQVRRFDAATGWIGQLGWPAPTLVEPIQLLVRGTAPMEELIACREGVLLARLGDVVVLSDPDVIANHGLLRGENAALAVAIVRHLQAPGAIVFDETTHGHRKDPSFFHELGRFPLVLVPVHLLLLGALLLWIASGRFGTPLPVPPPIGAGKGFLIDNIAALLQRGGRHMPSLRRFSRQRVRQAAARLHAPRGLSDEAAREWLLPRLAGDGRRERLAALLERIPEELGPRDALAVARAVHEITEEEPDVTG